MKMKRKQFEKCLRSYYRSWTVLRLELSPARRRRSVAATGGDVAARTTLAPSQDPAILPRRPGTTS